MTTLEAPLPRCGRGGTQPARAGWVRVTDIERKKEAGHVVVVFRGRAGAAGHPVKDVGVGAVEQSFVAVELSVVKAGQMGIRKAPEDQVALPRAAVPGTEQQPLAANLD
jgi:hypothetical protein